MKVWLESPHLMFLDSGLFTLDSGFPVLDSGLCQWNLDSGLQNGSGVPDSLSCIRTDSTF